MATVSGVPITANALRREMIRRGAGPRPTAEKKREALEELVRFERRALEARARGYERDPEIQDALKRLLVQKLEREDIFGGFHEADITDEDLQAYYEANSDRFASPRRCRGSLILFRIPANASAEARVQLLASLEALRAKAQSGEDFASLARDRSQDTHTRLRGGDMGWFPEGARSHRWPAAVLDALFALRKPGDLSPVVTAGNAAALVRLGEVAPGGPRPFPGVQQQVRSAVRERRLQELEDAFQQTLDGKYEVVVHDEVLEAVAGSLPPPAGTGPPAFPLATQPRN